MNYSTKQVLWTTKHRSLFNILGKLPGFLVVALVTVYQHTISPDHGIFSIYSVGVCRHRPTCSEYTKNAVKKEGAVKGLSIGLKQVKKCY